MSTDDTSGLFEIRLNDRGIRFIRKFLTIVRIAIITGIAGSLIVFFVDLGRITNDLTDYAVLDKWETAYFKTYPFFSLFLTGIFLVQLYHYWKVKQHLEEAINDKNEVAFNESFEALFKNAIWSLILGVASLIVTMIDLLFWINYY